MEPAQDDDDQTEPYDTDDTSVLTEEEMSQLQEEDVATESYNSDHFHFVGSNGTVFVPLGPKLNAAPDFGSYDVSGFNQFEQYLAKNGKKQPKAESVITPKVLRKYAKEIKQAKLEEFRSFLDFTAMTLETKDAIRLTTMSLDKDGQFKKFKARWVCRGFQDAQKYDLQTDTDHRTFMVAPTDKDSHNPILIHVTPADMTYSEQWTYVPAQLKIARKERRKEKQRTNKRKSYQGEEEGDDDEEEAWVNFTAEEWRVYQAYHRRRQRESGYGQSSASSLQQWRPRYRWVYTSEKRR